MDSHFCHQNSSTIFECKKSTLFRGRGERFAAEVGPAEGGEASLSELCIEFCLLSSTPCYLLAEVRRIYRLPPLPPTPPGLDESMDGSNRRMVAGWAVRLSWAARGLGWQAGLGCQSDMPDTTAAVALLED